MHDSRLQVTGSNPPMDGFFSMKKSSLPGGLLQYSTKNHIGGTLGLATDLPARIVSFAEWPIISTQSLQKSPCTPGYSGSDPMQASV